MHTVDSTLLEGTHQPTLIRATTANHLVSPFDFPGKNQGSQPQDWPKEATKPKGAIYHSAFVY